MFLLTGPLRTYFGGIWIKIQQVSSKKILSAKWRQFCLGLNVLKLCHVLSTSIPGQPPDPAEWSAKKWGSPPCCWEMALWHESWWLECWCRTDLPLEQKLGRWCAGQENLKRIIDKDNWLLDPWDMWMWLHQSTIRTTLLENWLDYFTFFGLALQRSALSECVLFCMPPSRAATTQFTLHAGVNRSAINDFNHLWYHVPLTRYVKLRVAHAPGMPGTFPRHRRLAISTCITARAWRTCSDAYRDR